MAFLVREGDKRVYYEHHAGSGVPIVLVHCWGGSSRMWNTTMSALLAAGRTVVSLDHRACGHSDNDFEDVSISAIASDVVELITRLGLHGVVLNGWSMGGAVVMEAARRLGDDVGGVVLTSAATPRFSPTDGWPYGGDPSLTHELLAAASAERAATMRGLAAACFETKPSDDLLDWLWLEFSRNSPRADACLRELLDIDQRELAGELRCPVLLLAGRQDAFIPYDGVEASVSLFRNARLVGFERCGHAPHLELGDAYRAELLAFASMLDGRRSDGQKRKALATSGAPPASS